MNKFGFHPKKRNRKWVDFDLQQLKVMCILSWFERIQQIIIASVLMAYAGKIMADGSVGWNTLISGLWSVVQYWPWGVLVLVAIATANAFNYGASEGFLIRFRAPRIFDRKRSLFTWEAIRRAGEDLNTSITRCSVVASIVAIIFVSMGESVILGLEAEVTSGWYWLVAGFLAVAMVVWRVAIRYPDIVEHTASRIMVLGIILVLIGHFVGWIMSGVILVLALMFFNRIELIVLGYTGVLLLGVNDWFCNKIIDAGLVPPVWAMHYLASGWATISALLVIAAILATISWFRYLAMDQLDIGRSVFVLAAIATIIVVGTPVAAGVSFLQDWAVTVLVEEIDTLAPVEVAAAIGIITGLPGLLLYGLWWIVRGRAPKDSEVRKRAVFDPSNDASIYPKV